MKKLLEDEQNGFRKERTCIRIDHLYALSSVVKNRKQNIEDTFVCIIDLQRVFDEVNRDLLWFKVMKMGTCGPFGNVVPLMYESMEWNVMVNG